MVASLFCGIVDLGNLKQPDVRLKSMVASLGGDSTSLHILEKQDHAYFGQVRMGASGPTGHGVMRNATMLTVGCFDLLYSVGQSTGNVAPQKIAESNSDDLLDLVTPLDGEFAFAHWESERQCLTLVRDPGGTRPLFYCHRPDEWFAFASLPLALCAGDFVDGSVNPDIVAKWVTSNTSHGSDTHIRDVERILPGQALRLRSGEITKKTYWQLNPTDPFPDSMDYETIVSGLQERIDTAIKRRLPTSGAVFTHLSGGLDSSAIAALAARAVQDQKRRVTGYAFLSRPLDGIANLVDEHRWASALTQDFPNIELVTFQGRSFDLVNSGTYATDFPSTSNPEHEYEMLLAHAAANGASRIFSGFGGDQLSSNHGVGALAELIVKFKWSSYFGEVRKSYHSNAHFVRRSLRELIRFFAPEWLKTVLRIARRRPEQDQTLMSKFLREEFQGNALETPVVPSADSAMNRKLQYEHGPLSLIFEELAWRASRHGLSYSFPLVDRDVMEYSMRIPASALGRGPIPRMPFRDAMRGVLPEITRLREEKLLSDPGRVVRVAAARDDFLKKIDSFAGTPAEAVFDLNAFRKAIKDMPDEHVLIERSGKATAAGKQAIPTASEFGFVWPLVMCSWVATRSSKPEA